MFVCLFFCWIFPPDPASFDTRVVHGKKRNLSGKVPIEKLTPSHQRFFLYERKCMQLSYLSTILFLSDVTSNQIPNKIYVINKRVGSARGGGTRGGKSITSRDFHRSDRGSNPGHGGKIS